MHSNNGLCNLLDFP